VQSIQHTTYLHRSVPQLCLTRRGWNKY
jgi:hypothetical protein